MHLQSTMFSRSLWSLLRPCELNASLAVSKLHSIWMLGKTQPLPRLYSWLTLDIETPGESRTCCCPTRRAASGGPGDCGRSVTTPARAAALTSKANADCDKAL
jgi:hypothetical protein